MNQADNQYSERVSSIYSDETDLFRRPAEPDPGDHVVIRLRIRSGAATEVMLLLGETNERLLLKLSHNDGFFDWYETGFQCSEQPLFYSFLIRWEDQMIHYDRLGAHPADCVPAPNQHGAFQIFPGFHVPTWSKGALQYQILPDRFRKGNPGTDTKDRECAYAGGMIRQYKSWDMLPEEDDYRCHYGGDLVGVLEKLDYLQSLGIEAIYFNPLFVSPSPHKYDTQDYDHIDPHLTALPADTGKVLAEGDTDNSNASMYIQRTTDPLNLFQSNAWFAEFCQEIHKRGMKIILDGVFNHCGSFHRWLNREGLYPGNNGAYGNPHSPYRGFFAFENDTAYDSWWGIDTLPKLHYEQSETLMETILAVAEKWALPPYSIDGWRLDVASDLGQTREFNHLFWRAFRRRLKAINPELIIIAEHYGNPSEWLRGDEWDTVMNYDAFMEPLSFFLTGMEKHSDYQREDLYQNGEAFFASVQEAMSHLPTPSLYCAMDELSNHDHSRFMTRTNGRIGRLHIAGHLAASEDIRPEVFREAAVIQMTWPGAPTIYYGDEAGLTGWTDPDNRRPYPWGHEDQDLINMFRTLAGIRDEFPVLRKGSMKPLCAGHGMIAYARFDEDIFTVTACNNTASEMDITLPLQDIGVCDGTEIILRYSTVNDERSGEGALIGAVSEGNLHYSAPPHSAAILISA